MSKLKTALNHMEKFKRLAFLPGNLPFAVVYSFPLASLDSVITKGIDLMVLQKSLPPRCGAVHPPSPNGLPNLNRLMGRQTLLRLLSRHHVLSLG